MKVTQVAEILKTVTSEILGDSVIVNEDLSNVVDVGKAFENMDNGLDNYVRKLQDHIGRMVFVDRIYEGRAPSVLMDGWEFGSILEKVRMQLPEVDENESWQLQDGTSYDPNIFTSPKVSAKFYNNRVTFEIPMSITEKQVKESFSNATQLNAFYSMIQTNIQNALTLKIDSLIMRTINSGIAMVANNETGVTNSPRAISLKEFYNSVVPEGEQVQDLAQALRDPNFIRFASLTIKTFSDRMKNMSTLFNLGKTEKFTPRDKQKIVLLADFKNAADIYLQSSTFHNELTELPAADVVPYWQGSGTLYSIEDVSKIQATPPGSADSVTVSGVLGVIFDRDAIAVCNTDRRVRTQYNNKAEFWNEWHKYDAQYIIDMDENFIFFYF